MTAIDREWHVLTDTHCHLNLNNFELDREAVLERAALAGVRHILVPGIDLATSQRALKLAEQYEIIYAAVGIHPNEASSWNEEAIGNLRMLLVHPKAVAVGEIGLDDYWEKSRRELQWMIFEQQLELAEQFELPVIIHVRDRDVVRRPALQDALAILTNWQAGLQRENRELASRPGVLHSFSGDVRAAERAIENSFRIGITGPVTFKKAELLKSVVRELPRESLLIETDAPFLAPHPHRGKRNEPAYVQYIANEIARLRDMEPQTAYKITTQNAARLFIWKTI